MLSNIQENLFFLPLTTPRQIPMRLRHLERHRTDRIGWLRAAVLGANDGIVSTASLMVGVAAANTDHSVLMITGVAGLVAGARSMAAGEYVSVYSQADTEKADIERERLELLADAASEHRELAAIYASRGLDAALAELTAAGALVLPRKSTAEVGGIGKVWSGKKVDGTLWTLTKKSMDGFVCTC